MTTFEVIVAILLAIIAAAVVYFCSRIAALIKIGSAYTISRIEDCDSKLGYIKSTAMNLEQHLISIDANGKNLNKMLPTLHDDLEKILSIYYMSHNAKFDEMMMERIRQGLKDLPLYSPDLIKPPFNPTCETGEEDKK